MCTEDPERVLQGSIEGSKTNEKVLRESREGPERVQRGSRDDPEKVQGRSREGLDRVRRGS